MHLVFSSFQLPRTRGSEGGTTVVIENQIPLNEKQAAKYLGTSHGTLILWRNQGIGPRYFRAGEKLIRYRRSDLDSWIEARLSAPTATEVR